MVLEKNKVLKKIEINFSNDEMFSESIYVYHICVTEDGKEIAKTILRETKPTIDTVSFLTTKKIITKEIAP